MPAPVLSVSVVKKADAPMPLGSILADSPALHAEQRIAWHTWRGVVGTRIASRTQPARIESGVLHVVVTSSTWASELSLLQAPILRKLNQFFPAVRSLRFRVGTVQVPVMPAPHRVLTAELPEALEQRLQSVDDDDLKQAIRQAAALSLGRQNAAKA